MKSGEFANVQTSPVTTCVTLEISINKYLDLTRSIKHFINKVVLYREEAMSIFRKSYEILKKIEISFNSRWGMYNK